MDMHKKEGTSNPAPSRFSAYSDVLYIGPVRLPTCSSSIAPEELVVVLTGEDVVTLLLLLPLTEPGPAACVVSYCDTPPGPAVVLVPGSLVVMFEVPLLSGVVTVELLPPGVVAVTALPPEVLVVLPVLLVLPPAWVTETLPIAEVQAPFASKL